ncbi:MAG: branched-chain amino acid ABC transporter ATP-binding protein/permease [Comamonadaceae bacterium]|nr:MAG: branched-chain amino acid ABC transporter ATP-binding protein/permease [Comamonadaceae bacterium]
MNKTVAAILAVGAVLASVPWLGLPQFYESILYLVCHWAVLALSWNILSGYSGYFSFGHGAFFGIGMYTTAALAGKLEWPFLATLPFAALIPALLGLGLGFVVFRVKAVRGELFALLTLAVTFVVATVILNSPVDGGPGVYLNAVETPKLGPSPASSLYLMILLAAIATALVAYKVYASKLGIGLFAIHDDEDVAEVMGVPTFRYKLAAFAISCALAGLAGGIHALFVQYVTAGETFNITVPLTVVLMSVLGGTRHWAGPAVGAAAITGLLYTFTAGDHAVAGKAAVGVILVLVILFMPDGILGKLLKRKRVAGVHGGQPAAHPTEPKPVIPGAHAVIPGAHAVIPGAHAVIPGAQAVIPGLTRDPDGAKPAAPAIQAGQPLLEVRNLSKAFKGVQALDKVTLQVRQGEILGLLGPNGSGKSTFINVVSGHYPLSGGEVVFDGQPLTGLPAHRIAHAGIARTYQIPRPFKHMTVLQNVSMVAMFGCASLRPKEAEREAWKWLEFTGLQDRAHAFPDDINLHQRKFLELARALAARPRLVLLDEVLSGLTPGEINEAIALIRRIRDQGSTIVFVEHVMRAVMALTDRIVVLNHGKLIAQGAASEVMQDAEVVNAYLGKPAYA